MKTFEEWLNEELEEINLGDVSEHEEGLLRGAYEAGVNAHKESVATVLCSVGLSCCSCHDWEFETKNKTFFWDNGSWNLVSNNDMGARRIYYCPMCGGKLSEKAR